MSEQIRVVEENGRLLNIKIDFEELFKQAQETRNSWDDDSPYQRVFGDPDADYVTKEEFEQQMDQMVRDIEALRDDPAVLVNIVNNIGRKKDGYFAKGRVSYYKRYDATGHYWEDSYGWYHCTIRARSSGPNIAEVTVHWEVVGY